MQAATFGFIKGSYIGNLNIRACITYSLAFNVAVPHIRDSLKKLSETESEVLKLCRLFLLWKDPFIHII